MWVEGQSVCWLSPGEIQELKSLVGKAVKPSIEKDQAVNAGTSSNSNTPQENSIPVSELEGGFVNSPKKTVLTGYEPLPENSSLYQQEVQENPAKQTVVTETKYARPLDELKELYAKNLEQRVKKMNPLLHIPPQIKKAAFYTGLIAAGVIAGVLIRNTGNKKTDSTQPVVYSPGNTVTTKEITPVKQDAGVLREDSSTINFTADPAADKINPEETATLPEKSTAPETKPTRDKVNNSAVQVSEAATVPAKKDEKKIRGADLEKETKIIVADEISSLVSVKSNEYSVGSFGGIRNLELTVTNTSKYSLDHVTVELRYLKPRDELLKAENISFRSIPPNGSQTLVINKSNRGVKVVFKIIRIESKAISSTTAGL